MANPLRRAHEIAAWSSAEMKRLMDRAGNSEHPRGRILSVYRYGLRDIKRALANGGKAAATAALQNLLLSVRGEVYPFIDYALKLGGQLYSRQIEAYGLTPQPFQSSPDTAVSAVMAEVERQITTAQAMLAGGVDEVLIVGDDERQGIIRATPVNSALSQWIVTEIMVGLMDGAGRHLGGDGAPLFKKQVVAGLDERTTECCLLAHGQVQPLEKPFELRGTPRYADKLDHTPFHNWCRSSVALYIAEYDDGLTDRMVESARKILSERAAGGTGYRHPASATA